VPVGKLQAKLELVAIMSVFRQSHDFDYSHPKIELYINIKFCERINI